MKDLEKIYKEKISSVITRARIRLLGFCLKLQYFFVKSCIQFNERQLFCFAIFFLEFTEDLMPLKGLIKARFQCLRQKNAKSFHLFAKKKIEIR